MAKIMARILSKHAASSRLKPFILRVHEILTRDNIVVSNHDPYSRHAEKKSQWLLFYFSS